MNVTFKEITLEDKDCIQAYLKQLDSMSCEFTFANIFLWSVHYKVTYAIIENMLVFRSRYENTSYTFPIGNGDEKQVIEVLIELCREEDVELAMHSVSKSQAERLEEYFPGMFQITFVRDDADYIYESEALISLAGKKYHGKRNHIRRFKENYPDWTYEEMTDANQEECMNMAREWRNLNGCEEDEEKQAEFCVTLRSIQMRKELGLHGGLIRAGGKVVAISIGEPSGADTFVVHIEKAFGDIQGAYPIINQQFAEHEAVGFRYINREDDVGIEGLRKAKLSYHPAFLLEKAYVTMR